MFRFFMEVFKVLHLHKIILAFVIVIKLLSQLAVLILQHLQGLCLHRISFFQLLAE